MASYYVGAHGGRDNTINKSNYFTPDGCKVVFYVADNMELRNVVARTLVFMLINNIPINPLLEVNAGELLKKYYCWYAKEFSSECGIFKIPENERIIDLSSYTEKSPLGIIQVLERIKKEQKDDNITLHWLSCTGAY